MDIVLTILGWIAFPFVYLIDTIARSVEFILSPFQGILFEEDNPWKFVFVTMVLGGWAAWMTGRACAQTWRPLAALVVYLLLLGIAVRFIHHALFDGTMFSFQYYVADTVVLLVIGILGYRFTRTNQMVSQYHWLYEKTSALGWKAKG
jgi:hypothetical protein